MIYASITDEQSVLGEAEERHSRILDANYSKVDLEEFVKTLDHISDTEQRQLLSTLKQFVIN